MFYKIIKVVFTICLVQHFFKGRKAKARRDLAHSRLFFEELRGARVRPRRDFATLPGSRFVGSTRHSGLPGCQYDGGD